MLKEQIWGFCFHLLIGPMRKALMIYHQELFSRQEVNGVIHTQHSAMGQDMSKPKVPLFGSSLLESCLPNRLKQLPKPLALRLDKAVRVAYEATLEQVAVGGRHSFKTQYKVPIMLAEQELFIL